MTRWLRRPIVWVPVSVALLALVAWRSRAWEIGSQLGAPDAWPLAGAVALNAVVIVAWALRSHDLLAGTGHPVGLAALLPLSAFANTINNLTPGSTGELARLWLLRAAHGVPYVAGGAVILVERVIAIAYLGASAAIAWGAHAAGLSAWVSIAGFAVLAAVPGAAYALGLRPAGIVAAIPLGRVLGRERWERTGSALGRLDTTVSGLLTNPRRAAVFALTSAAVFACYAIQLWLVARALGVELDVFAGWGALGLSVVVGVLSMLPFGLGAADLVLVGLLGALGVATPVAAAIAFGNRLVSTLPLGLVGIGAYAYLSARLPEHSAAAAMRAAQRAMADDAEGGA